MSSIKFGVSSCCEVFPWGISHIPGGVGMGLFPRVPPGNIPRFWQGWDGIIPNILQCSHKEYPISWHGWDRVYSQEFPQGLSHLLVWLGCGYSQYFVVFPQGMFHIPGRVGMELFPIFCHVPSVNILGWDGVIPNILECSLSEYPCLGWGYSHVESRLRAMRGHI